MLNCWLFKFSMCASLAVATSAFAIAKRGFDFVVGVDGDFKAAIAKAAASGASESKRFIIFLPNGEYDLTKLTGDEHGKTTFSPSHVSIIGQSLENTTISNTTDTEGISTTATLYFPKNNDMYMQDITLKNKSTFSTSGAARQVALQQNEGDKFIYKNVRLLSGQDTYYTKKGRTYWEGGEIDGTVDFICGGGDVFFEGTKLVMTRNGGYITASQNPGDWGYVFNNTTITVSNNSFNGTFYLGRSWGHAKVVFLNTKMVAQPAAEGWFTNMNSAPVVYGEYNSKDGNGNPVNTSRRRTYFDGSKDGSTSTLKTVWDANDAAKYTLANVLGGTDNWAPNKLTAQVSAPKISQEGANIVWDDDDNAICWAVFVNGKYHSNTTSNSIDVGSIAAGSKVTVRAANSMGGLGATSNEITVLEANVTYYKVTLSQSIGGTVTISPNREKIAEGTAITITAEPAAGWKFAGWTGKDAVTAGTSNTWKTTMTKDIDIGATFEAKGTTKFQAESGIVDNAIIESTNAGFAGTGYINFGTGHSTVQVPVYAEFPGEYTMVMTYANGSGKARGLAIAAPGKCTAGIDGCKGAETRMYDATDNWTTWATDTTTITLSKGAGYITFATVDGNDGPNLDQIELIEKKVEKGDTSTTILSKALWFNNSVEATRIYDMNGKLVRYAKGSASLNGLAPGIYIVRTASQGYHKQKLVQVR
ncbi:pectinesterase family protein [Fibrobacter sp.]|uniref:pectinesterase family protein n=1 Tax=Fibrobacter sp. TaxID=35828 RepID=UPI0025C6EF1D|nr:pectinesterase family protein [Fibrobacter sp.]MBR3073374.1 pectin esterase [Fibrobacter sp.]